jgi:lipopolysaccharide/colanic/teichoic acid biosynthesis glycosyltransferase
MPSMSFRGYRSGSLLLFGDTIVFLIALWLALFFRRLKIPPADTLVEHLVPFGIIFIVWVFVLFVFDLYQQPAFLFRRQLPGTIVKVQLFNVVLAILFFYLLPFFVITPKTILFLLVLFFFWLLLLWRQVLAPFFLKGKKEAVFFTCSGSAIGELEQELTNNPLYDTVIIKDLPRTVVSRNSHPEDLLIVFSEVKGQQAVSHRLLADFFPAGTRFISAEDLYQAIFNRVPISLVNETWFLRHIVNYRKAFYDPAKRITDIVVSSVLLIASLPLWLVVWLLMIFFDRGNTFSIQERVGQYGRPIKLIKFRTMTLSNDGGRWDSEVKNTVTSLGKILRRTRIDELPQLINVLKGDLSLIGPRPEFPLAVEKYSQAIPFYNLRHIIKPGLSGWAQMYHDRHPHHGLDIEETGRKLSYDLYYLRHRDFFLDLKISLKTIGVVLSQRGI